MSTERKHVTAQAERPAGAAVRLEAQIGCVPRERSKGVTS